MHDLISHTPALDSDRREIFVRACVRAAAVLSIACACATFLTACSASPGASLTIRSGDGTLPGTGGSLTPAFTTIVYASIDSNTADIILTDLPIARLADPADALADTSGVVVHLHMFLVPAAGRTPIDPSACNVSARVMVLADGARGLYGGGGFFQPKRRPGADSFSGSLSEATLRLTRSTPDFADRLGASLADGKLTAKRDDALALAALAKLESIAAGMGPVGGE